MELPLLLLLEVLSLVSFPLGSMLPLILDMVVVLGAAADDAATRDAVAIFVVSTSYIESSTDDATDDIIDSSIFTD